MTREVDVAALVDAMSLDEKAALTAGADMWSTVAVERLGIPSVNVTDGPSGARGPSLPGEGGEPSTCVPCGAALGATWDPDLVSRVGAVLGREARAKGCRVLLAPTVNIHRSPLAGRDFECYSEDPLLSGRLAAAFVRGAQSEGVVTTVKHFVGNDAETERYTMSSVIDPRTLREIYLLPFETAVRDGGSLGVMTAYNRLNGAWCTEDEHLLRGILRDEWGFDGFVLTDWFGIAATAASARAGLDLEMPGPGRAYGTALADAVRAGDVDENDVDAIVTRLLTTFARVGALDAPEPRRPERVDTPAHRAIAREAATSAIVLLHNDGLLPVRREQVGRVAIIGPNADRAVIMGGGSAQVTPPYRRTPLQALRDKFGDRVEIVYEPGLDIDKSVPVLTAETHVAVFAGTELAGEPVIDTTRGTLELLFLGTPSPDLRGAFSARATTRFTPSVDGPHDFTLVQAGRARVVVDGTTVLDGFTDPPPRGESFFGAGSVEAVATVELAAGRAVDVVVEYASGSSPVISAARVGVRPTPAADSVERAVAAARDADVAIVVVGTTNEWESEGHDRTSMDLPGGQDDLVARVVAANRDTVVVLNTGSPATMPWADDARAVVQTWFGGQEMADALADVLTGDAEPGGRLPTTFPVRLEHNPSYGNFPGERDEVRYGEGLLVGYRWYDTRRIEPRYCFGHGLSYTTFTIGEPVASSTRVAPGEPVRLDVTVTNTGTRAGSEVVQCYVAPRAARLVRPEQELKAFAKVTLEAGASETVTLTLDERAFAYWDPGRPDAETLKSRGSVVPTGGGADGDDGRRAQPGWRVDLGVYELRVGRSSRDVAHTVELEITNP